MTAFSPAHASGRRATAWVRGFFFGGSGRRATRPVVYFPVVGAIGGSVVVVILTVRFPAEIVRWLPVGALLAGALAGAAWGKVRSAFGVARADWNRDPGRHMRALAEAFSAWFVFLHACVAGASLVVSYLVLLLWGVGRNPLSVAGGVWSVGLLALWGCTTVQGRRAVAALGWCFDPNSHPEAWRPLGEVWSLPQRLRRALELDAQRPRRVQVLPCVARADGCGGAVTELFAPAGESGTLPWADGVPQRLGRRGEMMDRLRGSMGPFVAGCVVCWLALMLLEDGSGWRPPERSMAGSSSRSASAPSAAGKAPADRQAGRGDNRGGAKQSAGNGSGGASSAGGQSGGSGESAGAAGRAGGANGNSSGSGGGSQAGGAQGGTDGAGKAGSSAAGGQGGANAAGGSQAGDAGQGGASGGGAGRAGDSANGKGGGEGGRGGAGQGSGSGAGSRGMGGATNKSGADSGGGDARSDPGADAGRNGSDGSSREGRGQSAAGQGQSGNGTGKEGGAPGGSARGRDASGAGAGGGGTAAGSNRSEKMDTNSAGGARGGPGGKTGASSPVAAARGGGEQAGGAGAWAERSGGSGGRGGMGEAFQKAGAGGVADRTPSPSPADIPSEVQAPGGGSLDDGSVPSVPPASAGPPPLGDGTEIILEFPAENPTGAVPNLDGLSRPQASDTRTFGPVAAGGPVPAAVKRDPASPSLPALPNWIHEQLRPASDRK